MENPIFSGHQGEYSECSCLNKEQIIALDKVLLSSYLIKLKSKILKDQSTMSKSDDALNVIDDRLDIAKENISELKYIE